MSRLTVWLTVVALASSLAAVGCGNEKRQLAEIQQQYNDLQMTNQELQRSLAGSQAKNNELTSLLSTKEVELGAVKAERDDLKAQLATRPAAPAGKAPPPGWTLTPGGVKITLSSDILFASGRATLSSAGSSRLRSIVTTIRSRYPAAVVRVIGHTDSDPIVRSRKLWSDNLDLSANRAMAVTRGLRRLGIAEKQIETVAMGETQPIAPNTSSANKSKNRRVEIAVVHVE